jgi:hypothetical protein
MSLVQRRSVVATLAVLSAAWLVVTTQMAGGVFEIGQYISGGAAAAYGLAATIVGYLNSWWGFAAAVAAAAAFGLSWTVVLIKAVLQRVGFSFAVRYATML